MKTENRSRPDWTLVLRRRPLRIVDRHAEGGYTDEFELVCCDCGDDPGLDYCEVTPELQRVRGPYPIAAGIAAYVRHAGRHPGQAVAGRQAVASPATAGAGGA